MQPTYMPWAGYLNLMAGVDCFVYLDDTQYERSSWQNRNRVLVNGKPAWLTLPVLRGHLGANINEVQVDDTLNWRRKHLALLSSAYARHTNRAAMLDVAETLNTSLQRLSDLNIGLLEVFRQKLAISTPTIRSSSLGISGVRTERLIALLTKLGASEYVTPPGALEYLQEDGFEQKCSIKLMVHGYQPPTYSQRGVNEFISYLSILDVAAHLGWEGARKYVRSDGD